MRLVTPLRFVPCVIGLWVAARVAILMPDLLTPPAEADPPRIEGFDTAMARRAHPKRTTRPVGAEAVSLAGIGVPARGGDAVSDRQGITAGRRHAFHPVPPVPARNARNDAILRLSPAGIVTPGRATAALMAPAPVPSVPAIPPRAVLTDAAPGRSRWSGGAYLFRRGDGGGAALATGGQLGGSQAGARVAWRLDTADRFALIARVATPLDDTRGAEAASGVDWHPLPGHPLRVSVERRVNLGGGGRDAWSAYAAGGFWRPIGRGVVVDGYAQAGVVGTRRRDLFADGALRAGARRELGGNRSLTVGGGAWGAAQPGAARLDVGPRVALSLPLAGTGVTAAAEWRVRVAGDATPGSGLAITLAADF